MTGYPHVVRTPTTTGWRLFRATVFALVATYLAALGHVAGGGHLPDPAVLLTVAVFLGGSVSGLATRHRTGPQILGMLMASQVLFHLLFQLTAHHSEPTVTGKMLAFHLLAGLIAAALMAGGESALFRLFAAIRRAISSLRLRAWVDVALSWTALIFDDAGEPRLRAAELSLGSRRGPPRI